MTNPHILLVDDNPDEVMLATGALSRLGRPLDVDTAANGPEAIERLMKPGSAYDLVLLDLNLPLLSGLEVLARVRPTHPRGTLPIVMFTTSQDPKERSRAEALECDDFHVKPMSFGESVTLFGQLLEKWLRPAA